MKVHARALVPRWVLLAVLISISVARPVEGQFVPIVAGTAGGIVAGGWTTVAAFVARAKMGNFVFEMDAVMDIRVETLPMIVLPLAGAILGAKSTAQLKNAGKGAGLGYLGGGALGVLAGALLGDTPEARWAGGIIGSAAGLVVGAALGSLQPTPPPTGPLGPSPASTPASTVFLRIPFGGGH